MIRLRLLNASCSPLLDKIQRGDKIIFYCGSVTCNMAVEMAGQVLSWGYKNIYVYAGGYNEWQKNQIEQTKSTSGR